MLATLIVTALFAVVAIGVSVGYALYTNKNTRMWLIPTIVVSITAVYVGGPWLLLQPTGETGAWQNGTWPTLTWMAVCIALAVGFCVYSAKKARKDTGGVDEDVTFPLTMFGGVCFFFLMLGSLIAIQNMDYSVNTDAALTVMEQKYGGTPAAPIDGDIGTPGERTNIILNLGDQVKDCVIVAGETPATSLLFCDGSNTQVPVLPTWNGK